MTSDAVLQFLALMEASSIDVWLDGGWGIDALLGKQTRLHGDLDIIVRVDDVPRLEAVCRTSEYLRQPGGTATNFVLKNGIGHEVDVHAIEFDQQGFGAFALPNDRKWPFPPAAFLGQGRVQGQDVPCLSPEAQVQCHAQGYTLDEADLQDMQLLQDHFGVVLPLAFYLQPKVDDQKDEITAKSGFAPAGWPALFPRIAVDDPEGLVQFMKHVFHAVGQFRPEQPAELRIGDSMVMVGSTLQRQAMPAFLYVYVEDSDATYQRALNCGSESIEEPQDMPHGDRRSMIRDAWGNIWQIATHRGQLSP
jgi:uncharacterized glyoxalase superfamily protein PhnB